MKSILLPAGRICVLIGIILLSTSMINPLVITNVLPISKKESSSIVLPDADLSNPAMSKITMGEFSKMKVKEFEALSGQDLSFGEKMAVRGMRKYVKRQIRKGEIESSALAPALPADEVQTGFWIGFGLGFLFGALGFLGAVIWRAVDKENPITQKVVGGAAVGCLASAIVILILWLVVWAVAV